jgi:type II secretory pathway pseudopilin PulG
MNTLTRIQNKGFTIVETLVAITILMIAVAGPLVAASRSLNAALYSKDQMIASFLAQETMEVLKSYRSNYVSDYGAGQSWVSNGPFATCTDISSVCDVSALNPIYVYDSCGNPSANDDGGCILELGPSGYDHNVPTPEDELSFYRFFYLEDMDTTPGQGEVKAHVVVRWNQGKIPYEIELVSEIVDSNI